MTTDNRVLWKSTIVVALIVSMIILLTYSHIKGMWVIYDLSEILWLFWLGVLWGDHIKAPEWLRCSAFVLGLGLVVCTAIPSLEVFFPEINWFVFGYMLLGLSVPIVSLPRTMSLKESCFLCILFGLIYYSCVFLSQRTAFVEYGYPRNLTNYIHNWIYSLTTVPLLGLIYCLMQISTHEKIQKLVDNKVIRWECIGVCVAAFIICIVKCLFPSDWSLRIYYLFQLALCPIVFIIIKSIADRR